MYFEGISFHFKDMHRKLGAFMARLAGDLCTESTPYAASLVGCRVWVTACFHCALSGDNSMQRVDEGLRGLVPKWRSVFCQSSARYCTGLTIGKPRKGLRISKSWSPVRIRSARPSTANSRNLSSLGWR